jgi:hypothetical protein
MGKREFDTWPKSRLSEQVAFSSSGKNRHSLELSLPWDKIQAQSMVPNSTANHVCDVSTQSKRVVYAAVWSVSPATGMYSGV